MNPMTLKFNREYLHCKVMNSITALSSYFFQTLFFDYSYLSPPLPNLKKRLPLEINFRDIEPDNGVF